MLYEINLKKNQKYKIQKLLYIIQLLAKSWVKKVLRSASYLLFTAGQKYA